MCLTCRLVLINIFHVNFFLNCHGCRRGLLLPFI
ncbi:hypothetical protein FXB70_00725 [Aggregatibacter actinomycetemcomitans]|nr:hypothetical protein FXB91_05130 [Aggregatibacter actinomycetemcomitans]TYA27326.1 hypothetical protein FXB92_04390 [Aggregatibacter actinomycetemcomitans]TYA29178.1 hypothetical protein FXB96_05000 [Aggregatibacter actinomycetemcomitans]TYA36941.1 hypothetical protein FXE06_05445 [Aggregatibacter actinomycetemcomitans]TYA43896.1 hypothetical protein FXB70_00725 [Aggregatibacter actinomycetemcomitans]